MKKSLLLIFLACSTYTGICQSINPFTIWNQVTQRGDITFTGNSMLTCAASGTCTTALNAVSPTGSGAGNNYSNNGFTMNYINIADAGDPVARFSRSNANLTLGSTGGCGVIYAVLCWGGNITSGTTNYSKRDSIYLKSPAGGYTGLKADLRTDATSPFTGYYCYKDVTSIVKQAGSGTYWVANQVLQNGATNLSGGWVLAVIYFDPLLPLRNLTIFRGLSAIGSGQPQNITINGFFTPPSPAVVNIKLGVFAFEGDRGTVGDSLKFNGNPAFGFQSVTDSKHTADNAFTSTINNNTAEITRNPASPNTLGVDANIFVPNNAAFNFLPNGATSATVRMSSTGDVYAPFMISTAIDVFEPDIKVYKDGTDLNGGMVELGDTLLFSLKVVNKGTDPADSVILVDSLYGAMNFVPNSLKILTGPNSGVKTDIAGDDQAEFNNVLKYAKFRLGNGANATKGGKLGITALTDSVTTMEFKVTVTPDCQVFHCNPNILNKAYAVFYGQTSGAGRSTYSSPNGLDGLGCPLQGATTLVVNVPVCAPIPDTSITGCVPYSLDRILPARPGYNQYFNSTWNSVTQATATGIYYALKQIYPGCNDTIQINFNGPCVVPIILTSFQAVYRNRLVTLQWETSQEINNREFRVERSADGLHFETIATIPGSLNSQVHRTYSYTDSRLPAVSRIFYRITQVDLDGRSQTSSTRVVFPETGISRSLVILSVSPIPATSGVNLVVLSPGKGVCRMNLFNETGQLIRSGTLALEPGQQTTWYDCRQLTGGFYMLEISNPSTGEQSATKLMIRY